MTARRGRKRRSRSQAQGFPGVSGATSGRREEVDESQLVVRATDGEGKLQISEYRDPVPDGATGLHRVRAKCRSIVIRERLICSSGILQCDNSSQSRQPRIPRYFSCTIATA